MEVIHDAAFWRELTRASSITPAKSDVEYRIHKSNSGFSVSGPALGRPSVFHEESRAVSFAKHLIGPSGGMLIRVGANGKEKRQRVLSR